MEITQKEINSLANKVGKVSEVFQLRGAFSGTLQAAQTADGFLSGLAAMFD